MLGTHVVKHHPLGPRDKSDRIDSAKIADYLYRYDGSDCTRPYELPGKVLEKLKKLMGERKFLVEQRTGFMNRKQTFGGKEDTAMHAFYNRKRYRGAKNRVIAKIWNRSSNIVQRR